MQKRSFYRTWTSDIPVTRSGCIRIRVTGVSVFVRKFGWDCTRKSDISVIRSGCIRFHFDFEVHEKATRSSQDTDFACSCLSKTLNYCTRKSEIFMIRSGFVRILDILILKLTRIAWRACHFCVGKLGFYCTRKSDTPVTRSGWNRTLEIQKFYFACLLACLLLLERCFWIFSVAQKVWKFQSRRFASQASVSWRVILNLWIRKRKKINL